MKPELQRRVQRYGWDWASDFYETRWQRQLAPAQERMLEAARIEPGEQVLDVACGTGLVTFPVARAVGARGHVTAVDLSDKMVETATRQAEAVGIANVSFRQMDAEALDFPDGSFDVVVCGLGLMYFPEPVQSLREMHRVLRPGGRCAVAVWGARDACGWAEIFPVVERRVSSDVCPLFFQLGTGRAMEVAFEVAGFENVESERLNYLLEYDDESELLEAMFAGGPVALAYRKFSPETRADVHADFLKSVASYRHDGDGFSIPGEFVVASARRPL
ncbi:MAG TPA: class I SAM-dependent methyltransferase [Rhodothermales bacterium]